MLKERAKTLPDLADGSQFFMTSKPIEISEKAAKHIHDESIALLAEIVTHLEALSEWSHGSVETLIREFCHDKDIKMGKLLPAIRAATTGIMESPPLFPVLEILGQEIVVNRIKAIIA